MPLAAERQLAGAARRPRWAWCRRPRRGARRCRTGPRADRARCPAARSVRVICASISADVTTWGASTCASPLMTTCSYRCADFIRPSSPSLRVSMRPEASSLAVAPAGARGHVAPGQRVRDGRDGAPPATASRRRARRRRARSSGRRAPARRAPRRGRPGRAAARAAAPAGGRRAGAAASSSSDDRSCTANASSCGSTATGRASGRWACSASAARAYARTCARTADAWSAVSPPRRPERLGRAAAPPTPRRRCGPTRAAVRSSSSRPRSSRDRSAYCSSSAAP